MCTNMELLLPNCTLPEYYGTCAIFFILIEIGHESMLNALTTKMIPGSILEMNFYWQQMPSSLSAVYGIMLSE